MRSSLGCWLALALLLLVGLAAPPHARAQPTEEAAASATPTVVPTAVAQTEGASAAAAAVDASLQPTSAADAAATPTTPSGVATQPPAATTPPADVETIAVVAPLAEPAAVPVVTASPEPAAAAPPTPVAVPAPRDEVVPTPPPAVAAADTTEQQPPESVPAPVTPQVSVAEAARLAQQQRQAAFMLEKLAAANAAAAANPPPPAAVAEAAAPISTQLTPPPSSAPARGRILDDHLTPSERRRAERRAQQRGTVYQHNGHQHLTDPEATVIQHGGHSHTLADAEQHGGLIFGTMLVTMMLAQLALVAWKKFSPHTLDQATLAALWLFPLGYSVYHGIWEYLRMITIWCVFSLVCGLVMRKALKKPIERRTPRTVYKFFYFLYRISYAAAVAGYGVMMMHFLGLGQVLPWWLLPSPETALLLGFYGLYYGVVGRDLANVCSQGMAVSLGYVGKKGEMPARSVPRNVCAICDGELVASFRPTSDGRTAEPEEPVFVLGCGHQFHENCLRGWTMIGKRDTCANCNERVVLSKTSKQPWETTSVAWGWLLDVLRYLIVFNPIFIAIAQGALYLVY